LQVLGGKWRKTGGRNSRWGAGVGKLSSALKYIHMAFAVN